MSRRRRQTAADGKAPDGGAGSARSRPAARWVLLTAVVLGLIARGVSLWLAPQYAYLPDHLSNMGWATYAVAHGPWHIYDLPKGQPLVVQVYDPRAGRFVRQVRFNAHPCNYPPASVYLFWLEGLTWHALDHEVVSVKVPPRYARRMGLGPAVSSRLINTRVARLADALPGLVFDGLLAWGVAGLLAALGASRWRQTLAASLVLVAPPIFLDSALWNQADSWITCLLVWTLVMLLRRRMWWAGVLYGVALMTKPQAIIFVPVIAYVLVALRFGPGGTWRRVAEVWKSLRALGLTVAANAGPFMATDARAANNPHGAWRWLQRSYVETIGKPAYARTTLSAFNIWWFDLLSHEVPRNAAERDNAWSSQTPLGGLSKAAWGKLLLALGVLAALVIGGWRGRWEPVSWVQVAFLITLAAFVLPTSVHERYVYYCIPLAIALACCQRRWIPPLLGLLLVGTGEMLSYRWAAWPRDVGLGAAGPARPFSLLLAAIAVGSLVYGYLAAAWPGTGPGRGSAGGRRD